MSIKFIYGEACSGKSHYLYQEILKKAKEDLSKHYIFVVPEQYALSVEKNLIDLSPNHGILNIEVLSFTRLAYRIMEEAGDTALPKLNDVGKTVLLRNIMQELKPTLTLYAGKQNNIGFLDEMKSIISELSQYLITPENLSESAKNAPDDTLMKIKLGEISQIYKTYDERLKELGFTTAESLLELCFKHIGLVDFLKNATFVFDGFTGFTPVQYEFIERLMMNQGDFIVSLTGDESIFKAYASDSERLRDLFIMSKETVAKFTDLATRNGILNAGQFKVDYSYNHEEIVNLKRNIYHGSISKIDSNKRVEIFSLYDKREECHFVAAEIAKCLRANADLKYKDFAVITGDIDGYAPFIAEQLNAYGIPYYLDRDVSILNNPLIVFTANALKVVAYDFKAEDVCAFIKSPLLNIDRDKLDMFENYLLSRGYRGKKKFSSKWEAKYRNKNHVDLEVVNEVRAELFSLLEVLIPVVKSQDADVIVSCIKNFYESCKVETGLVKLSETLSGTDVTEKESLLKEYARIYEAVILLFEQIVALLNGNSCTLKEFNDIFMAGVKKTKLGFVPKKDDVVTVGDVWRTRISGIKTLFFIGVNEGVVPRTNNSTSLFNEDDRNYLLNSGLKLSEQPKENPAKEKFYIYLAMAKPKEKLYVTYEMIDENNLAGSLKEKRPSSVIDEISKHYNCFEIKNLSDCDSKDLISYRVGFDHCLSYLSENYNDYAGNNLTDPFYDSCLKYIEEENSVITDYGTEIDCLNLEGESSISRENAAAIYNDFIYGSVSRIEEFNSCNFKHFLDYGLGLEERPLPEPQRFDYGNVMHNAFHHFMEIFSSCVGINNVKLNELDYNDRLKNAGKVFMAAIGGCTLPEIAESKKEAAYALANECLHDVLDVYEEKMYKETKRLENISKRMEFVMKAVTDVQLNAFVKGGFRPAQFEYPFKVAKPGKNYNLVGRIDRVDVAESDGEQFVKVIDYKTGVKQLSLQEFLNGTQLQLPLYLDMLKKGDYSGCTTAASVYQALKFEEIKEKDIKKETIDFTLEEAEQARKETLKQTGLINKEPQAVALLDSTLTDDSESELYNLYVKKGAFSVKAGSVLCSGEQILKIGEIAEKKIEDAADAILNGQTTINPLRKESDENPESCKFCPYKSVCGYDRKIKNYRKHENNYANLTADKAKEVLFDQLNDDEEGNDNA